MKTTAKAKYGLQIEGVQILAGDTFNVVGSVVAFKGVLVDLTKFPDAFEIVKEHAPAIPVTLEVVYDIQLANGIVIEAGTKFKVVNDIVELNGGIIDIAKYTKAIKVVEEVSEENPADEPSEEPSNEPVEPANKPADSEEPEVPAE